MKILIVDDHPTNRELLRAQLETEGFTVLEAADGLEALSVLGHETVDTIISDVMMPRMDGYRLCLEVRKSARLRSIPFIVYTSTFSAPGDEKLALEMGADRYLTKPAPANSILDAIREVQTRVGPRPVPKSESQREVALMKEYSEQLVAKLEERNVELTQLTAELQATQSQLRQLLAHSPAVLYALRLEGPNIIPYLVSENMTELLGFTVPETLRYDWWVGQLHAEDRERAVASLSETLEQGVSRTEYRLYHKDRSYRWVEDNRRLTSDSSGQPKEIVGVWMNISERKRTEIELAKAHKELLEFSRQAGMAEVATSVLHNVGNVLNSINVASTCLADSLRRSKAANLSKVVALLREHEADMGAFLTADAKGKLIPGYLSQLAEHLSGEQASALKELAQLQTNVEHIKDIVSMQQNSASVSGMAERITVTDLVEDALRMNAISLSRRDIQILKEFEEVPPVMTQKQKVLQILVNLIRNANQACDESGHTENRVTLRVARSPNGVRISVSDNGVGISAENLTRIFAHGFTTKKDGHGFGLHGAALAAKELGGWLTVRSDGVGQGATFVLELPLEQPKGNATGLTNQARPSA